MNSILSAPDHPELERRAIAALSEMTQRNAIHIAIRADLIRYALPLLTQDYPAPRQGGGSDAGPIWQFWAQGEEQAPPVIRACLESVRTYASGRDVILLDAETWKRYVTLDPRVADKLATVGLTHFSDILRLELLQRYGGTWIDASVMLTDFLPDEIEEAEFFAFRRNADPYLLSSWFLSAKRENAMLVAWREMLMRYWSQNDTLVDYFLIHHLFECGVTLDPRLRAIWQKAPALSAYPPHALQNQLMQPYRADAYEAICGMTGVHKLTYKLPPSAPSPAPTFLDFLARDHRA